MSSTTQQEKTDGDATPAEPVQQQQQQQQRPEGEEEVAAQMPEVDVAANLQAVRDRIATAAKKSEHTEPRLVAVSKFKPLELILDAYAAGQRVFGENYVQELVEKSKDPRVPEDLQFHFIGRLQSNKSNTLARVKNLAAVESVASEKLARHLNRAFSEREVPLRVFIQVNTSGEEDKGGVEPDNCEAVARFIREECPHLELAGLMTIGMLNRSLQSEDVNEDFQALVGCRERLAAALGAAPESLELSMGMSADFEHAIEMGSTNVRVGSTIFGARDKTK